MYHVPCARNTSQGAVRNITMQMRRLLALDKSIFRTCNDGYRHLQQPVLFPESVGRGNHQSRFQQRSLGSETVGQPSPLEIL